MKLSKKNIAPAKATAKKQNTNDNFLAARHKQSNTDGIMEALGDLYQQINGQDKSADAETLPEDEVTLEEIIARGNLPDETFIIDYGSEDDVPPPSDADYLEFYEPTEVLETVVNIDEADLDENFDSAGIPSKESVDKKRLNQDFLPNKNLAAIKGTAAASTTLAEEHRDLLAHQLVLTPEEDELYEAWREAEPLPLLDPEDDDGFILPTDDTADADETVIPAHDKPAEVLWDNAAKIPADYTGARCMFCSHPLETGGQACGNCGAPINPRRFFHDWSHAYAEPGMTNPNLAPCRFCGRQVYRRVHVCPKCGNVLLKPVYTPEEITLPHGHLAKTAAAKQKSGGFKYILLILIGITIAAVIISKALVQAP